MIYPSVFVSAFYSACADCGRDIGPGDLVRIEDGGHLCEDCAREDGYCCDC